MNPITPEVQAAIDYLRGRKGKWHDAVYDYPEKVCNAVEKLAAEVEQWKCNNAENKLIAEENSRRADKAEAEVERLKRISGYALKLAQDIDPGQNAWGDMIREEMKP